MELGVEHATADGDGIPPSFEGRRDLVGRDALLARAVAAIADPAVRLLTLTGPGGIGKTTLARAVAAAASPAFPDGVALVELAAERDPDRLLLAVVQALELEPEEGEAPLATLARSLAGRRLLVLDNLEQLLGGTAPLGELLGVCPGLTMLATSRTRLNLRHEHELAVPPLTLPDADSASRPPLEEVAASAAVQLFVRRAQQVNPAFGLTPSNVAAVAEVCRRLDGLPLALELGAARLRLLSPEALLARLDHRLELLSGGPRDAPERHRTIRYAVGWSVDLLRPDERRLFGYLAVFAGGCTVDDLEAVTAAIDGDRGTAQVSVLPAIEALIDGALLQTGADANGDARLTILESVRDVAAEALARDGRTDLARRCHAARYLAVAERDGPGLRSDSATQLRVWNRLNADIGNLRAALAWFLAEGNAAAGLRLAAGLDWFWSDGAYLWEGIDWIERLVAVAAAGEGGATVPPLIWGEAHRVLAMLHEWLTHEDEAERAVAEAIRALTESNAYASLAEVLIAASGAALERGQLGAARAHAERCLALAEDHGLEWSGASMGVNLAIILTLQGETAAAVAQAETAIERYRRVGERGNVIAAINTMGLAQLMGGELPVAARSILAALDAAASTAGTDEGEGQFLQAIFNNVGQLAYRLGQPGTAVRMLAAAAAERSRTGVPTRKPIQAVVDGELGLLRAALGEPRFHAEWATGLALTQSEQIALADRLLRESISPTLTGKLAALSPRELDVLRLIVAGCADKDIGDQLFISRRTASQHVSNVLAKLELTSRTAAATYASQHGIRGLP